MEKEIMWTLLESGQVWFAQFKFAEDRTKSKDRPVLILEVDEKKEYVWAMKITKSAPYDRDDFVLKDWQEIPLLHQSTISPRNTLHVPIKDLRHYVGYLSERDWNRVQEAGELITAVKQKETKSVKAAKESKPADAAEKILQRTVKNLCQQGISLQEIGQTLQTTVKNGIKTQRKRNKGHKT